MERENYGNLIKGILALISSAIVFFFNIGAFSLLGHLGSFTPLSITTVILQIVFMIAAVAFAVINIVKIACKKAVGVSGLVCVIFAVAAELLLLILDIVETALWGMFFFPTREFIATLLCVGLMVGFIVCNKKFPSLPTAGENAADSGENVADNGGNEGRISIGLHIVLMIFFGFVWQFVWIYRTTKYLNSRTDEKRGTTGEVLLCMFVPFYVIYWIYKTAQCVDKVAKNVGVQSDITTLCLVLEFLIQLIPPVIIQQKVNEICNKEEGGMVGATQPVNNVYEDLKKYKDLLDEGVITAEEYDRLKGKYLSDMEKE